MPWNFLAAGTLGSWAVPANWMDGRGLGRTPRGSRRGSHAQGQQTLPNGACSAEQSPVPFVILLVPQWVDIAMERGGKGGREGEQTTSIPIPLPGTHPDFCV